MRIFDVLEIRTRPMISEHFIHESAWFQVKPSPA